MQVGDASRWSSPLAPGEPLRHLGELETGAGLVEAMAYAPGRSEGRHWHSRATLIYILSGDHWAVDSRGGDTCRARTVRFLPAGEPHATYFPLGSTCLQVEVRPSLLELAAAAGPLVGSPGEVRNPAAPALGVRLCDGLRLADDLAGLEIEAATLELLLRAGNHSGTFDRAAPAWVLRVADMLREELRSRVALSAIALSVGRHPVQVSRAFHRHFRCTISEYVRRARVARAQMLLRGGELPISEIALECGFCDQSHFTTTFRRLSGVPPQRYRTRSRAK